MPVGPELPPHLAKRKRSVDDSDTPNSPPRKLQAALGPEPRIVGPSAPPTNPDELNIEDDTSEDDYAPSKPIAQAAAPIQRPERPSPAVGPTLPPSHNPDELDINESSEDEYAPSKPSSSPPKRILGPAPPPANLSQRPSQPANSTEDTDSSDDDDYGPSLPPAPGSHAESQMHIERAQTSAREEAAHAKTAPKRDDWMLVPPSDNSWGSRIDPTKLKNRKFQSGKGSKAPIDKSGGISAIWTETPEQKRKRLEDEVLGRTETALNSNNANAGSRPGAARMSKEEQATARRIQEYNEKNRSKSLYDEHNKQEGIKEQEDDPSKRGFDREKDMAIGGRMGHGEKREMLVKAKDFGSRFQKGKYL